MTSGNGAAAARGGEHEAITAGGLHHRGPAAGRDGADAAVAFDVETPAPGGGELGGGAAAAAAGKDADAPLPPPPGGGATGGGAGDDPGPSDVVEHVSYAAIARQFSLLGWTAFGGPAAHIGIMQKVQCLGRARGVGWAPGRNVGERGAAGFPPSTRRAAAGVRRRHPKPFFSPVAPPPPRPLPTPQRLVDKLHWMTTDVYAELFALAQCIPGPASTQVRRRGERAARPLHARARGLQRRRGGRTQRSPPTPHTPMPQPRLPRNQVSFACGIIKRGVPGGLLSGVLFQYPGAIIMAAVGVFAAQYLANPQGWLNGLTAGAARGGAGGGEGPQDAPAPRLVGAPSWAARPCSPASSRDPNPCNR
jgi:hypothetical protein